MHLKSDAAGVPTCICTAEPALKPYYPIFRQPSPNTGAPLRYVVALRLLAIPSQPQNCMIARRKLHFDFVPVSNKYAMACRSTG